MINDSKLTEKIIGCAIEVHKTLGPGFLETIYEQALRQEFITVGLQYRHQENIEVIYKGGSVGTHRFDFLVEERVIVELKAIQSLDQVHFAQVRSYMKAWNKNLGLLLNFSANPLSIKKVFRETSPTSSFLPSGIP